MILTNLQNLRLALWRRPAENRPARWGLALLRRVDALLAILWEGHLSLWAMSLVYTTLLSLTPLLALGFSLLKALGVHNSLEPVLLRMLQALGPEQSQLVVHNIIQFVDNIRVGVLGSVGVALLLYSALSLIQKVESSFNHIWRVERPRGLPQRFSEYLAVLMIGPVVVFSVLGLTASALDSRWVVWLGQIAPLGFLLFAVHALLPYALIVGMFTFLYAFIPNTPVRMQAAFVGGLFAGVIWQSASFAFAAFVSSATNYNAIYSGFAIVIFVLIWLHLGWLILLLGCQLAYFTQHPERMGPFADAPPMEGRAREQAGLALIMAIVQPFLSGQPPLQREALARLLKLTPSSLVQLAVPMVQAGVLAESGESWLPARDPDSWKLHELWCLLRGPAADPLGPAVQASRYLDAVEAAAESAGAVTLRDWVLTSDDSKDPTAGVAQ